MVGVCERCGDWAELKSGICGSCGDTLRQEATENALIEQTGHEIHRRRDLGMDLVEGEDEMNDLSLGPGPDLEGDDDYPR